MTLAIHGRTPILQRWRHNDFFVFAIVSSWRTFFGRIELVIFRKKMECNGGKNPAPRACPLAQELSPLHFHFSTLNEFPPKVHCISTSRDWKAFHTFQPIPTRFISPTLRILGTTLIHIWIYMIYICVFSKRSINNGTSIFVKSKKSYRPLHSGKILVVKITTAYNCPQL